MARLVPRRRSLIELFFLACIFAACWYLFFGGGSYDHAASSTLKVKRPIDHLPCSRLPGADDTVVVIRTSAAEIEENMPVHVDTTLGCYPNSLIFSDWKESFQGYEIQDALATVDIELRESHADFELWRRLQRHGSDGLEDEEMWNPAETVKDLEKWKHLPMVNQTYALYPDKKWYVFLETKTYIFWNNLLSWLSTLDHEQPYYIGTPQLGDAYDFALAGAGIILSRAAIDKVTSLYLSDVKAWEKVTKEQKRGDAVLGKVASGAGVSLTNAWPVVQAERPGNLDYSTEQNGKRLWCYPTVSYGDVSPENVVEMWKFEQQWTRNKVSMSASTVPKKSLTASKPDETLRHRHVFKDFILPRLAIRSGRVDDWDNFSANSPRGGTPQDSIDGCKDLCLAAPECVQFSHANGTCHLSELPKMGDFRPGMDSRWLLARTKQFADRLGACSESWTVS